MEQIVISTIDVCIESINPSSPGQGHVDSWVSYSPVLFPATSESTWAMITLYDWTRKRVEVAQRTIIGQDLWLEYSAVFSAVSTHHQEEQKKHQGDEIYTNMDELP